MPSKLAIVFHRFGPYHRARIESLKDDFEVLGIELSRTTAEYDWERISLGHPCRHVIVCEQCDSRDLSGRELYGEVDRVLSEASPDVVAINGWADNGALATLRWCLRHRVPTILMSESNRTDFRRRTVQEFVKSRIVRCFDSALVGGTLARDYVCDLGMPADRVFVGYDAIDNGHFHRPAGVLEATVRDRLGLPRPYFLASNRFIEKKNLPTLLDGYARYRQSTSGAGELLDLVLLGDGELKDQLVSQAAALGVTENVRFAGFLQYDDLPPYYWGASAFVHASSTEQWGLVINEAMAAGLPVIASNRCGSTADLVAEGETGFTFDPDDKQTLAEQMGRIADDAPLRQRMGLAGRQRIDQWGPNRFADGMRNAVGVSRSSLKPRWNLLDRLVLGLLCR